MDNLGGDDRSGDNLIWGRGDCLIYSHDKWGASDDPLKESGCRLVSR
jgi:hypothetical protein